MKIKKTGKIGKILMTKRYDFLIIGSGMFGCVFSQLAKQDGYSCLILEKRDHLFGNCYTEKINEINYHKYGPHIFHTSNKHIWQYVNQFGEFNNFVNRPKVNFNDKIYSFPINLFTLYQLWSISNPIDAKKKLDSVKHDIPEPKNLEEWILSQVGEEIYRTFVYGYTKKQWNTEPKNLPADIIKRLPIRIDFNDNYFNDIYQGIPVEGYSGLMSNMIDGIETVLQVDYFDNPDYWNSKAKNIVYTGPIDRYFNYSYGKLEYRSLRFETEYMNIESFQGNAVINYTSDSIPFTRIVEHKYFDNTKCDTTIITKEYPANFADTQEPYYPINTDKNQNIYDNYRKLKNNISNTIFGGRLAEYQYMDMHQVIGSAIKKYETYTKNK